MALPKISINRGKGGLGRPLASKDHISGFIMPFTTANLPTGFGASDRIKIIFSIDEAEALGIVEGGSNGVNIAWYHINQFFVNQPKGKLYVYLIDDVSIDYGSMEELQNFANGEIRQVGFYDGGTALSTTNLNSIQTACDTLEAEDKPLSVIYAGNTQGVADLGSLPDLRALSNKNVSVVIGEDGNASGKALADSLSQSITCLGACLGAIAFSKVHENIGWVDKFNMVDGAEFDVPAISITATTVYVKDQSVSALDSLNDKGYIFLKKHVGIDGSYFNDSPCANAVSSDYAYIENNRTIDKAIRGVRTFMLPNINSPLYVQDDGTLTEDTISRFKNDSERALEQMERDGELSAFLVTINPAQDVLTTSKISIAIKLVPVGVAREIEINIGFAVSVS